MPVKSLETSGPSYAALQAGREMVCVALRRPALITTTKTAIHTSQIGRRQDEEKHDQ